MATKEGIATRREQVLRALLRRVSKADIAKRLGVSYNTVLADARAVQSRLSERIAIDPMELVAESVGAFAEVEREAWRGYEEAAHPTLRQGFLATILKARKSADELLLNVGVIPKATPKSEVSFEVNGIDITKLSTPELLKRRNEIAKELLQLLRQNECA